MIKHKNISIILITILCFFLSSCDKCNKNSRVHQKDQPSPHKKKVLFINSYHKGYTWSDRIENAAIKKFKIKRINGNQFNFTNSKVILKIAYMDTKRNQSEAFKKQAALKLKKTIENWEPDLLITADDNAAKYLIVPYYMKSDLPIVFCGLNWDAQIYGFPTKNITGIVEKDFLLQPLKKIKKHTKGNRIGYLAGNTHTSKKIKFNHEKLLNIKYHTGYFASTFTGWLNAYKKLQKQVDVLILYSYSGIPGWNKEKALSVILTTTQIPSIALSEHVSPYSLIGMVKNPDEQGEWAANTALKILAGKSPHQIPIAENRNAKLFINMDLANKLKIKFSVDFLSQAHLITNK